MIDKLKKIIKWLRIIYNHSDEDLPIYLDSDSTGLKLHIGSGPLNLQGWVNVDARNFSHIHICSEGFDLDEFVEHSISEIYMCHVLEHFSFEETKSILMNFRNKLKKGGLLRLSVPDFGKLVEIYESNNNDVDLIKYALMGGQDYNFNFHKSVYNKSNLSKILNDCGYKEIKEWKTEEDFGKSIGDWSDGLFKTKKGDFPVSLNLIAQYNE
jgi:predicted SAM-dependent methyltransferase